MLSGIDLFRLAADRMRYLTQRQTVIGRNIANADTPGYRAQDLAPFNFSSKLLSQSTAPAGGGTTPPLMLARTQAGHISDAADAAGTLIRHQLAPAGYGEKPDGNTVSIEEQMVKSADVANAFSMATAAYAKSITLLKIGIDSGR